MDRLLKSVVHHSPTGLVLFGACRDADGRINDFRYLLTNPANAKTTQLTVAEMTGNTLLDLFPTIAKNDFFDRLVAVVETGAAQHYQHFYQDDGIEAWVDASLVPVDDGVLFTFQDVTELMRRNQELTMAREAAEQAYDTARKALQVRDIFLANISHEIRTPLNIILGFSELLAEEIADPEHANFAASITNAGNLLLKLINNVLDLAKLDANQLELESQPVVLVDALTSVASLLGSRAGQKKLRFRYRAAAELPTVVLTDELRLTQILVNLGENAVKFTRQGEVQLRVERVRQQGDRVVVAFTVQDTGIGIAADRLPVVFDRYQQTSTEITRHYGGSGLGLNIVQSLVQHMGGTIGVRSELGRGTEFRVEIPFAVPAGNGASVGRSVTVLPPSADPAITVLLVEDNPYNQRLVENLMHRSAITLLKARHGLEALKILRHQRVDLVLMDLQMPLMGGYATTRHIRQRMNLPVPIIALTANALTHERENCFRQGINDYLTKPFTRQELVTIIAKHSQMRTSPTLTGENPAPQHLDLVVLEDLYGSDWPFLGSQYAFFETEWPSQCELLNESLVNGHTDLFSRQSHKFCTTLNTLAMTRAAKDLKNLSQHVTTLTADERGRKFAALTELIEETLTELKQHIDYGNQQTQPPATHLLEA